jgi:hypothetical protein
MDLLKDYEVKEIIYENNFQRISLCINNQNKSEFYNNIILSSRIIELIDTKKLENNFDNVIAVRKDEDRAYIFTQKTNYPTLEDFIKNQALTMKEQLRLTEELLYKFKELESFEDLIQESMVSKENICINDNKIFFNNLLIFSQDYDISESILVKSIGNYIHLIYTGEFIVDYNISDKLPPDIMRLVLRCYSNQYLDIDQIIEAFKKSATYSLVEVINKTESIPEEKTKKIFPLSMNSFAKDSKDVEDKTGLSNSEDIDNDNKEYKETSENKFSINKKTVSIALIIVIPFLILFFSKLMTKDNLDERAGIEGNNNTTIENPNSGNNSNANNSSNLPETINDFYSKELIETTKSKRNAEIDFTKFYDGYSSLIIDNETGATERTLFAVIDMNSQNFSYMKNRQVGISLRLTSEVDNITGSVIVEVIENDRIAAFSSEKITISNSIWTLNQSNINLGNAERIELYFEYSDISPLWIDGIEIDILK